MGLTCSKTSLCPLRKGLCEHCWPSLVHWVQCQVPAWDPRSFQAQPWLLPPGLYLLLHTSLPAAGEERSRRATFCGLKVICELQQERSSLPGGMRGAASQALTWLQGPWLGWGTEEWQPSRVAVLISAPAPCLKNRELCSALGFSPLPLFKAELKALWITCKSGLSFACFSPADIMAPFESKLDLWLPTSPCPSSWTGCLGSAKLSWG